MITFEQFCEEIPDGEKPWLDRKENGVISISGPCVLNNGNYWDWHFKGYLIQERLIPHDLIDAYTTRYEADNGPQSRNGWKSGTPYMQVPEIKDICLYKPLTDLLEQLIGEPMGMNLNLTDWVSTERNWHQDDYLNPEHVNGHYLAVWIALDDIHPDSGPFEFVPGSHKWPAMRRNKVLAHLEPHERDNPDWPRIAERFLDGVFDEKIKAVQESYIEDARSAYTPLRSYGPKTVRLAVHKWDTAKKGDVLIWHSWLAHRGSRPKNPDLLRKSLICHYSGINHRPDMREPVLYENGVSRGYYFPF